MINYLTRRITSLPKINGTSGKNQILFLLFFIVDLFHGKKKKPQFLLIYVSVSSFQKQKETLGSEFCIWLLYCIWHTPSDIWAQKFSTCKSLSGLIHGQENKNVLFLFQLNLQQSMAGRQATLSTSEAISTLYPQNNMYAIKENLFLTPQKHCQRFSFLPLRSRLSASQLSAHTYELLEWTGRKYIISERKSIV